MNGFYEPEVSGHGSRAPGSKSQDQPACGSKCPTLPERDGNGRVNFFLHKNLHF